MAQLSIVPAASGITALSGGPAAPQSTDRAFNLSVSTAVRAINGAGFVGQGREVTFSVDPGSRRPVVKVVETATQEVVEQWPAEYALQLAADYAKRDSR